MRSGWRRRTWSSRATLTLVIATASGGCGLVPNLAGPGPGPIDHLDPGATPPPGALALIERATLDDERSSLLLEYIAGPRYEPDNPCSSAYVGWAATDDADPDLLHALVIDVTPPQVVPNGMGCDAVGHRRFAEVALGAAFDGDRLVDDGDILDRTTWFLRRPPRLATAPELPAGWTAGIEESLDDSPGGRWSRTYAAPGTDPTMPSGPGTLRVIQGFGQGAAIAGGGDERDLLVNDSPGVLSHDDLTGELVLVWQLGPDGMGLVANEADFSAAALVRIAQGMRRP